MADLMAQGDAVADASLVALADQAEGAALEFGDATAAATVLLCEELRTALAERRRDGQASAEQRARTRQAVERLSQAISRSYGFSIDELRREARGT